MKPIYLVGARASGKNTVGRILAEALGRDFIDLDQELVASAGRSIAEIVASDGWAYFRKLEEDVLSSAGLQPKVVATGGGVVLSGRNRELMKQNGTVIYLKVDARTLANRLYANPDEQRRPSLTGKPVHEEIAEVLGEREDLYTQSAHLVQEAHEPPEAVAFSILSRLKAL